MCGVWKFHNKYLHDRQQEFFNTPKNNERTQVKPVFFAQWNTVLFCVWLNLDSEWCESMLVIQAAQRTPSRK